MKKRDTVICSYGNLLIVVIIGIKGITYTLVIVVVKWSMYTHSINGAIDAISL